MKILTVLISIILLASCSIFKTEKPLQTEPQLLKQSPLPPVPESLGIQGFEFYCEMLITETGIVERAKIIKGSGDAVWDSLAAISLLDWKFSPATFDGKPIKILARRKINVVFSESKKIMLAEAVFPNLEKADSAYKLLLQGEDFNTIIKDFSVSPSREKYGFLGWVDIQYYSKDISRALARLRENDFTKPLPYGENYIIFMRLAPR